MVPSQVGLDLSAASAVHTVTVGKYFTVGSLCGLTGITEYLMSLYCSSVKMKSSACLKDWAPSVVAAC